MYMYMYMYMYIRCILYVYYMCMYMCTTSPHLAVHNECEELVRNLDHLKQTRASADVRLRCVCVECALCL